MAGNCSKEDCFPDETGCNHEGCHTLTECKYYSLGNVAKDNPPEDEEDSFYIRTPWTGNVFGIKDLNFLGSYSPITLVGITGVASAGKTTFLATLYCLLRNGHKIGDYTFAGSLTLIGWENIAWYLSWKQHNDIQFPPHTSSNSGRIPGMLHISLRNSSGDKKELVFTDAPGEWFDHWTTNSSDPNAAGANWIHEYANAFLLFADCEMLSGSKLGKARQQTKGVADRLKHNLGHRPMGLIWSKSDIEIDQEVKQQISGHVQNSAIEHYKEFETSVRHQDGESLQTKILDSIEWIISTISEQNNSLPEITRFNTQDLFLSKR